VSWAPHCRQTLAVLGTLAEQPGQACHCGAGGSIGACACARPSSGRRPPSSAVACSCSRMRANSARVATSDWDTTPSRRARTVKDSFAISASGTITKARMIKRLITRHRITTSHQLWGHAYREQARHHQYQEGHQPHTEWHTGPGRHDCVTRSCQHHHRLKTRITHGADICRLKGPPPTEPPTQVVKKK
jgi:hypothetical protein